MAYCNRADATLGLRSLTGIVDDEGIDYGHIADQRLGPAGARQCHRLARQPFQRAMRAHMDQRMDPLLPEPKIERNIGVAGNAGEIVIVDIAACDLATLGLDRDDRLAASDSGKVEFAVAYLLIVVRRAPGAL